MGKTAVREARVLKGRSGQGNNERIDLLKIHRAFDIARYYGFDAIKPPSIEKIDQQNVKTVFGSSDYVAPHPLGQSLAERSALLRHYGQESQGGNSFLYYERHHKHNSHINLEIVGSGKSIAEALLIQTAIAALRAEGIENLMVEVNSMGDRDSISRFGRELSNFYRKHVNDLSPEGRQCLKKDPFSLITLVDKTCEALQDNVPETMGYLSEPSRDHFRELLECLEFLDIPYRVNTKLISDKNYCCHTVFEVKSTNEEGGETSHMYGTRYNSLWKKIGGKREIPAVGATIVLQHRKKDTSPTIITRIRRPRFYLIQMGDDAKLKCVKVIEHLRSAKIHVHHSLTKDKIGLQISQAEALKVPYVLIMGQRECVDNTIIVRNVQNRSQDTIRLTDLPSHLRQL